MERATINMDFFGYALFTLLMTSPSTLWANAWTVAQITHNSYDDQVPSISGSNIIWQARGDVFLYDGHTTKILTHDGVFSQLSGSNVVWSEGDGVAEYEIFYHNGSTTTQITQNGLLNMHPQVSGSNLTWWTKDHGVYFYDGAATRQLASSASSGIRPKISGTNVVWAEHDGNDSEVFLFDGTAVKRLTDNNYDDVSPVIDANNVAWVARGPNVWRVEQYDGQKITEVAQQNGGIYGPAISGNRIAWYGSEGVSLYNGPGSGVELLADRGAWVDVSETHVVWSDGGIGDESEVFVYDGSEVTQLTDNGVMDIRPRVSGNSVVWWGSDGHDEEVFLARPVPEPTSLAVWLVLATSFAYLSANKGVRYEWHRHIGNPRG